jgi:hypothetical protein
MANNTFPSNLIDKDFVTIGFDTYLLFDNFVAKTVTNHTKNDQYCIKKQLNGLHYNY